MCRAADKGGSQLYKEEGKEGAEITKRVFQGHLVVLLVSMSRKVKSSVKLLLATMQSKIQFSPSLENKLFLHKQMRENLAKRRQHLAALEPNSRIMAQVSQDHFLIFIDLNSNLCHEEMSEPDWAATLNRALVAFGFVSIMTTNLAN